MNENSMTNVLPEVKSQSNDAVGSLDLNQIAEDATQETKGSFDLESISPNTPDNAVGSVNLDAITGEVAGYFNLDEIPGGIVGSLDLSEISGEVPPGTVGFFDLEALVPQPQEAASSFPIPVPPEIAGEAPAPAVDFAEILKKVAGKEKELQALLYDTLALNLGEKSTLSARDVEFGVMRLVEALNNPRDIYANTRAGELTAAIEKNLAQMNSTAASQFRERLELDYGLTEETFARFRDNAMMTTADLAAVSAIVGQETNPDLKARFTEILNKARPQTGVGFVETTEGKTDISRLTPFEIYLLNLLMRQSMLKMTRDEADSFVQTTVPPEIVAAAGTQDAVRMTQRIHEAQTALKQADPELFARAMNQKLTDDDKAKIVELVDSHKDLTLFLKEDDLKLYIEKKYLTDENGVTRTAETPRMIDLIAKHLNGTGLTDEEHIELVKLSELTKTKLDFLEVAPMAAEAAVAAPAVEARAGDASQIAQEIQAAPTEQRVEETRGLAKVLLQTKEFLHRNKVWVSGAVAVVLIGILAGIGIDQGKRYLEQFPTTPAPQPGAPAETVTGGVGLGALHQFEREQQTPADSYTRVEELRAKSLAGRQAVTAPTEAAPIAPKTEVVYIGGNLNEPGHFPTVGHALKAQVKSWFGIDLPPGFTWSDDFNGTWNATVKAQGLPLSPDIHHPEHPVDIVPNNSAVNFTPDVKDAAQHDLQAAGLLP